LRGSASVTVVRDRIKARGAVPAGSNDLTKSKLRNFVLETTELNLLVLRETHVVLLDIQRERGPQPERQDTSRDERQAAEGGQDRADEGSGDVGEGAGDPTERAGEAGVSDDAGEGNNVGIADLLARAKAVAPGDLTTAIVIIEAAARLRLNGLEKDQLLEAIKSALGRGYRKASLQVELNRVEAALRPTLEQLAAADAAVEAAEKDARRARLAPLVDKLSKDPAILDRIAAAVAASGVVRERRAIIAVYLAATSRLNRKRCLSLLRRGAPASGKNFLVEAVLALLPPESLFIVSGGSPKSLIYSGSDVDALKHKLIYLPEAAATLAVKNGVEGEFTAMIRTLISEGYIRYHTVVAQNGGPPAGLEIIRNGPIATIVTSARDNIEEELMTRLLLADSDESQPQSSKIMTSMLDAAGGAAPAPPPSATEIESFRDFQRWLELDGPYDVVMPFACAVRAAFTLTASATPRAVRVRRDLGGLVAAVSASAILHRAQRQTNGDGWIVATLDDYKHAFDAFAPGLAALYRPQMSAGVVALVRALEGLIEGERKRLAAVVAALLEKDPTFLVPSELTFDGSARATHNQLKAALGIASDNAIKSRVRDALTAGIIEIVNPNAPRSAGSRYRVNVASTTLAAAEGVPVFPTPEMVEAMSRDPARAAAALAEIAAKEDCAEGASPASVSSQTIEGEG
jgi:hypothetical protein